MRPHTDSREYSCRSNIDCSRGTRKKTGCRECSGGREIANDPRLDSFAWRDLDDLDAASHFAGDDPCAVRAERERIGTHHSIAGQRPHFMAAGQVPNLDRAVPRGRSDVPAIRTERERTDSTRMAGLKDDLHTVGADRRLACAGSSAASRPCLACEASVVN